MRSDDDTVDARRDGPRDGTTDRLRDTWREASRRHDDAPAERVRAAVLAAAARGVDAPPLRAVTDATTPSRAPMRARRWPLSAAALLVVSVMTGLVATRVLRDEPERVTTMAAATPPAVPSQGTAAGDATTTFGRPAAVDRAGDIARPPIESRSPAPAARREIRPSPPAAARIDEPTTQAAPRERVAPTPSSPREDRSRAKASSPEVATTSRDADVVPGPDRPAFVAVPPVASPAAPASKAEGTAADSATAHEAGPAHAATDAPRASPSMTAARTRPGRAVEPASPEAWVARIVKLRADGNEAEADRELEGLRQRYPGFAIPPEASKPTGTR